jgi:DNA-binding GntR family transcriptional regulator
MDNISRLDTASLRERVYQTLQEAIVVGTLGPGARLRDQDLAVQLGVSRTPVREALQRLEDEGLVETHPRTATHVTPLSAQAARAAFPVVAALHALATRLAVPQLPPTALGALRSANATLAGLMAEPAPSAATIQAAIQADDRFHAVFLAAADNAEIAQGLARVMPKVRRLEYCQFGSLAGRTSVEQHRAIIAACEQGDATAAAALVEENWLSLGRLIVASLGDDPAA